MFDWIELRFGPDSENTNMSVQGIIIFRDTLQKYKTHTYTFISRRKSDKSVCPGALLRHATPHYNVWLWGRDGREGGGPSKDKGNPFESTSSSTTTTTVLKEAGRSQTWANDWYSIRTWIFPWIFYHRSPSPVQVFQLIYSFITDDLYIRNIYMFVYPSTISTWLTLAYDKYDGGLGRRSA